MRGKVFDKLIAIVLILIMTFSYWGVVASQVYAEYTELENQEIETNNKNVRFDAYFKNNGENVHEINTSKNEPRKLYMALSVDYGYLKQVIVKLDNPNFSMSSESFTVSEDEINLGEIQNDTETEISINFQKQELIDYNYFSRITKISLSAVYIDKNGKEREIKADRQVRLNWESDTEIEVSQNVDKVIDLGSGRTLLQTSLKLNVKNNSIPVENTKIVIDNPQIDNATVENAKIYAIKTTQANGIDNSTGFTEDNWEYNAEESKLIVNIENLKTENNKIAWKDGTDEFKTIYIINSNNNISGKNIKMHVTGELTHNEKAIPYENSEETQLEFSGKLVDANYLTSQSLNKGYTYAKSNETTFLTRADIDVSYSDVINNMQINFTSDNYANENGDIVNGNNGIIIKATKINKKEFISLFGEEGKIEIYSNGEKVGEITKDSSEDAEGNVRIGYGKEINNIEIKTSKPEAEGKIEITNEKAVKAETGYSVEEIKNIKEIVSRVEVETNISREEKEGRIELKETVSKAELKMVTENLSTVVKNENVEMRVLFRTDSNMYDLYKNPEIEIELPRQIEEVGIRSIEAAFGEGFSLREYAIEETEEGNKKIVIKLNGEQTKYAIDISEGMSIIVKADMRIDKKSGSSEETVKLRYRNEKAIGYDNGGEAEGKVRIEAPTGVVAVNSMEVEGSTATSLSSKEEVKEIEILTERKEAKMTIDVINNYEKDIENPTILGRVPYEGNKKETGEELGSTFTAKVVKGIEKTEGIEEGSYKIYYSSNGEATEEIGKAENGWTEKIEEVEEVRSYLIAVEGYTMGEGEAMSFEYGVEIPEGLNHNESSYGTYAVKYGVEEAGEVREEKIVAPTVGATTGAGPELEVSLEASVENNAEVEEGQIIKYNVVVKNVGEVDAKNVKATASVPDNLIYVEYIPSSGNGFDRDEYIPHSETKEFTGDILTLKAGETQKIEFFAKVKAIEEAGKIIRPDGSVETEEIDNNISIKAKITADDLEKELETNAFTNVRVSASLTIDLESIYSDNIVLSTGDIVEINATVKNPSETEDKHNLVSTYIIPEGYDFVSVELSNDIDNNYSGNNTNYNESTRTLTVNIYELNNQEGFSFKVTLKIKNFEENESQRDYHSIMSITCDEMKEERKSNIIRHIAGIPILEANQTSNKEKYLSVGEEIQYIITIRNTGIASAKEVKIEDILPNELDYIGTKYETIQTKGEVQNGSFAGCTIDIPANSEAIITIRAKAKAQEKEKTDIENNVKIIGSNIENVAVNSLKHTILNQQQITDQNGNPVNAYTVSGTAWEDTNKNGRKDSTELTIANIGVCLIDAETGNIATKISNGNEQRTTTDSNGQYIFSEVKAGKYIVVFLYDTSKYNVTEYKKAGILENESSKAIKTEIKLDGENRTAGITETIQISDTGISGINIGLIKLNSTVFGIDKVVTKMVMQNTKTSKTVEFNNSKLAKMDVDGKYINSTNLVIEYKITVTNEGDTEGYVKKIVDNIPSEFKFSTDLNKDWYVENNGEAYNTSLSNVLIKPGESKEVTLVLTKKMTETGDGTVHNTAQIAETYNEYGAENIINNDSERAGADVIIGIKTGKEITFIGISLLIIFVIGIGVYFINKKVIGKEK